MPPVVRPGGVTPVVNALDALSALAAAPMVPVDLLRPDVAIERLYESVDDSLLRDSIAVDGIVEPLIVRPDMTVISGHRRLRVARELGLTHVPCVVCDDGAASDEARALAAVVLNAHRPMTVVQRARLAYKLRDICAKLVAEHVGQTAGMPGSMEVTGYSIALAEAMTRIGQRSSNMSWEDVAALLAGIDRAALDALLPAIEAAEGGDGQAAQRLAEIERVAMGADGLDSHLLGSDLNQAEISYEPSFFPEPALAEYPTIRASSGEMVRFDYATREDRQAYLAALVKKDLELRKADASGVVSVYVDPNRPFETAVVLSGSGPRLLGQADIATRMRLVRNLVARDAGSEVIEIAASDLVHCGYSGARVVCFADHEAFDRFRRGIAGWLEIPVLLRKTILY